MNDRCTLEAIIAVALVGTAAVGRQEAVVPAGQRPFTKSAIGWFSNPPVSNALADSAIAISGFISSA
jgi:hypothetical protein